MPEEEEGEEKEEVPPEQVRESRAGVQDDVQDSRGLIVLFIFVRIRVRGRGRESMATALSRLPPAARLCAARQRSSTRVREALRSSLHPIDTKNRCDLNCFLAQQSGACFLHSFLVVL